MSNVMELPYVCDCGCNFVNGDMFYDHFRHLGTVPTAKDLIDFEVARRLYQALCQEREDNAQKLHREQMFRGLKNRNYVKRSTYWSLRANKN